MAMSLIRNNNYKTVGEAGVDDGRGEGQLAWYQFAAQFCKGHEVIDVGCGLGGGLEALSKEAKTAYGIDLDERLKKENIKIMPLSEVASKSVDTVVCIDVIEHVKEDLDFVEQLLRVARKQVIISTPNYTAGRCRWPYHIREYMPHELVNLFAGKGKSHLYKGTPGAEHVYKVKYPGIFSMFNKLRVSQVTGFGARCVNKILPPRMKILNHLFIRVLL